MSRSSSRKPADAAATETPAEGDQSSDGTVTVDDSAVTGDASTEGGVTEVVAEGGVDPITPAEEPHDATADGSGEDVVAPAAATTVEPGDDQREGLSLAVGATDQFARVTSDAEQAEPKPTARRFDGTASGPLAPPDKSQEFAATPQGEHAEDAGPRMDEVKPESPEYVNADGEGVSYEDIFEDDGNTFVTVKARTWRIFTYPNSVEQGRVLAFREGRRIGRTEAEGVRVALTGTAYGE